MKKTVSYLAMGGQWFAGVLLLIGIIIEVFYMANLGFIAITVGACTFAIFTKIRELYYKALSHKNQNKNKE